jgi:NADH-quinone oxidoreductase subunit G
MQMIAQPRKAYVLLGVEPELDCYDPALALAAVKQAQFVVRVPLPAPCARVRACHAAGCTFHRDFGTFVSTEGRAQTFGGVVAPSGGDAPGVESAARAR